MSEADHGGRVLEIARVRDEDFRTFLDFSASLNPLGPPPEVLELLRREIDQVACYPEGESPKLLAGLARYAQTAPEGILLGNGATELIYFLLRFLRPRRVVLPVPTFSEYHRACRITGADFDPFNFILSDHRGDWTFDWPGLLEQVEWHGGDLLVLVHPNNPTGALLDEAFAESLLETTRARGTAVLLDESFIDFVPGASWIAWQERYDHLLILRSLTKFFALAGLRLGYLIGAPDRIAKMRGGREPWPVNQLALLAAEVLPSLEDYSRRTRDLVSVERNCLLSELASLPGLRPFAGRANFILVQADPEVAGVDRICRDLLRERILIRNCRNWPGLPANCFRLAVRSRSENGRLLEALRRLL